MPSIASPQSDERQGGTGLCHLNYPTKDSALTSVYPVAIGSVSTCVLPIFKSQRMIIVTQNI